MNVDARCMAWVVQEFVAGRAQKAIGAETGLNPSSVCLWIKSFCDEWSGVDVSSLGAYNDDRRRYALIALEKWFIATGEEPLYPMPVGTYGTDQYDMGYWYARREHAWLLRAEGMTYRRIGERLGVSNSRAGQMVDQFGRRVRRAMRRTMVSVQCW